MATKKMNLGKVGYAAAGGIVAILAQKFIPFGGNYKPAIPLALGAVLMQQKGEAMQFAGAGMVGEGAGALVQAFVPTLKISDDVTDEIYNRIMLDRQINGDDDTMDGDDDTMDGDDDTMDGDDDGMDGVQDMTLMGVQDQTLMGTEDFNY
jgi:hypothetical protein